MGRPGDDIRSTLDEESRIRVHSALHYVFSVIGHSVLRVLYDMLCPVSHVHVWSRLRENEYV